MWLGAITLVAVLVLGFAYWLFATMTAQTQRYEYARPAEEAHPGDIAYYRTALGTWSATVVDASGRSRQVYGLTREEAGEKARDLAERALAEAAEH